MQDLREDRSTSLAYPENANKHTEQSLKKLDLEYDMTREKGITQPFFFIGLVNNCRCSRASTSFHKCMLNILVVPR
jgi:hypothetical protein